MRLTSALVATLFGSASGSTGTGDAASGIAALKSAQAKGAEERGVARERKDPVTITALKQFEIALGKAKDVQSALKDPRVLTVLLPALGLSDQAHYPALVQKALLSDPADKDGLLAKLGNSSLTAASKSLQLYSKGLDGLKDAATRKKLADAYVEYQYRSGLDEKNAGISDALYFLDAAKGEDNVYNILGNKVMRRVVTGALGLPESIVVQSVETQARAITSRLDLDDLKDPRKLQKLAERYVISAAGSADSTTSSNPLLSLLA